MDLYTFHASLQGSQPPRQTPSSLAALWYDACGDWDQAHELVQDDPSLEAAWVHAYLHRKEGDDWNARYWYRQAGKPFFVLSLQDEWQSIVSSLLNS